MSVEKNNETLDKNARGARRIFRSKNLKYGVNSAVITVIVIAIAVVLNLLVGLTDIKFDLTPNKMYTIGDVTKELLDGLDNDVEIIGLFDELQPPTSNSIDLSASQDALNMVYLYGKYPHIKLSFIDPDKNPGFMHQLDPEGSLSLAKGNYVVRRSAKIKKITLPELFETQFDYQTYVQYIIGMKAEEVFSGAVKYVAAEDTPIVYFVEGHKETGVDGFSSLCGYLLNNNYLVEPLNLIGAGRVPADAGLLVFASPKIDLVPQEIDMLSDYFKENGGKAVFMFDYDEQAADLDNFNRVLGDFAGLAINNDKVRSDDDGVHLPGDPYTILFSSDRNAVFADQIQLLLNNCRSVTRLINAKEWITQTPLLATSEKSFSEPVGVGPGGAKGPLDIAVAVENRGGMKESKIVAIGNSTFITDSGARMYGQYFQLNTRMFLNVLRWMLGDPDTLTIESKTYSTPRLTITGEQANFANLALIILLPLLIMGTGLAVYLRRRHL